jgi:hypothetical protein
MGGEGGAYMGDVTAEEKIVLTCTGIMVVLILLAIYAGVEHYKFWKGKLHGTSLSTTYQKARMVLWLFGVAVVGLYSIVVLWLFGFWVQLFMELFED